MYKELSLMGGLSREENYQVPMDLDGEVTNVNLKIFHDKSEAGHVTVTMENEGLGKIAAEFKVDSGKITGMVACENEDAIKVLDNVPDMLTKAFEDKKVNVSLAKSGSINLNLFGADRNKDSRAVSTAELYKTAKVFLKSLKQMGDN
jgi:major membrane immunogen (membrane-anchored lipoprotein)